MNKLFLYHMVPVDMKGSVLYPLNSLKNIDGELFKVKSAKYEGREKIMDWRIPTLNAIWNDTLHLSAVPPKQLKDALVKAGMEDIPLRSYQIDPETLDPAKITVYLYSLPLGEEGPIATEFVKFNLYDLEKYSTIPKATKIKYAKACSEGRRPLAFEGITHILYQGTINIRGLLIVKV